ncbi:MAG: thioredoxin family protein [Verrucomicrobiota bacterium]
MKNKLFLSAIAVTTALTIQSGQADSSKSEAGLAIASPKTDSLPKAAEWSTDFEAALKKARETRRPILLDFTGSDWCGWCMKLDHEVLATPEFKRFAQQHLVLVKIDFPRHKAQSESERNRNEQLAARFQVPGFPTLVLLDPEARPRGTLSYAPGGPGPLIERLASLLANPE